MCDMFNIDVLICCRHSPNVAKSSPAPSPGRKIKQVNVRLDCYAYFGLEKQKCRLIDTPKLHVGMYV